MEKILKYVSLIYIYFQLIGFVASYSFYSVFDIDITRFISISEFFMLFLKSIELNILIFCFLLIFILSMYSFSSSIRKDDQKSLHVREITHLLPFLAFIPILIILLLVFFGKPFEFRLHQFIGIFALLTISLFFLSVYHNSYFIKTGKYTSIINDKRNEKEYKGNYLKLMGKLSISKSLLILFLTFSLFFVGTFQNKMADITKNKEYLSKNIIQFEYKDKIIITNDDFRYIGGTNNYMFFYDKKKSTTHVYERYNMSDFQVSRK